MERYIVLGFERDINKWRAERSLPRQAVIGVSPTRYTGALRGWSLDCEVITLPSWSHASPELVERVTMDLALVRMAAQAGKGGD